MKTALVLGVNGQDGSYLAEVLIERGYDVTGVARQAASRWVDPKRFRYIALDIAEAAALDALLAEIRPDEIYAMAAVHGSSGYAYEAGWRAALAVNVGSVHTCLEHMRMRSKHARLFYPSSLKAFGAHPPHCISETTPRVSDCLYSITKNAATELIRYYRTHHGAFACVGYYFNHDSPRRPDSYFLPRLAARIADAAQAERRGARYRDARFLVRLGEQPRICRDDGGPAAGRRARRCDHGDRTTRLCGGARGGTRRGGGPCGAYLRHKPRARRRSAPISPSCVTFWAGRRACALSMWRPGFCASGTALFCQTTGAVS